MLAAFREKPADYAHAAKAAGVTRSTAVRAWSRGWPGRRSLKDVLGEEQVLARALLSKAALAAEAQAAPLQARHDAAQSRASEILIARAVRGAAFDALREVTLLRGHAQRLAVKLAQEDVALLSSAEAIERLKVVASLAKHAAEIARESIELERLRAGDATAIIDMRVSEAPVSVVDVQTELASLQRAVEQSMTNGTNGTHD